MQLDPPFRSQFVAFRRLAEFCFRVDGRCHGLCINIRFMAVAVRHTSPEMCWPGSTSQKREGRGGGC